MDYSGAIIKEYDEMADRRVAAACRLNVAFMIIVGLLNVLGIFMAFRYFMWVISMYLCMIL